MLSLWILCKLCIRYIFWDDYTNILNSCRFLVFDCCQCILRCRDPQDLVDFASTLLSSDAFIKSIFNSLSVDGVFVSQLGEVDMPDKVPDHFLEENEFVGKLAKEEFTGIKLYTESHGGFMAPWKFTIAFKSHEGKYRWFFNQAEADYELHQRAVETTDSNDSPFLFYDGATHQSYQDSSRISENAFCTSEPTPPYCEKRHGYDPERQNINIQSLQVRSSEIEGAGRGIFFTQDFAKGSYVAIDEGSHNIMFMPSTTHYLQELLKQGYTDQWKTFDFYMFGYGFSHDYYGEAGFSVDPSIMTFINHGCNGTYNMGTVTSVTEMNADHDEMPLDIYENVLESYVYNPFIDRNHHTYLNGYDVLLRDVKAGEELLDNYVTYLHEGNWKPGLVDYNAQCSNKAAGAIKVYETTTSKATFSETNNQE
jgi:hypothetical protein